MFRLWKAVKGRHAEQARTVLGIALVTFVAVSVFLDPRTAANGDRIAALITGTGLIFGSDSTSPAEKGQ